MKKIRCAIYTRKSAEEGLEQEFNSLDAQREACAAYVASQKAEGWVLLPTVYEDAGISGGTLERPGLQRLLADIDAGLVEQIVVYKVDRLTRSLSDFAKLVERLEAAGAVFVSVTQSFNTATSMGRLTLHMLLSFAQFEREVTAERIRDKIAASKRKGLWMGGRVPLGYEKDERTLRINEAEAETVQTLYALYRKHGTLRQVKAEADRLRLRTKQRFAADGTRTGGLPFRRGHLHCLLTNPLYAGRIRHQRRVYEGQHPSIIAPELWDAVQTQLQAGAAKPRRRTTKGRAVRSPLAGKLFDETGDRLTPSHTKKKNGQRLRYYVSRRLIQHSGQKDLSGWRLPAPMLEQTVVHFIRQHVDATTSPASLIHAPTMQELASVRRFLDGLCSGSNDDSASAAPLLRLIRRVDISPGSVSILLDRNTFAACLSMGPERIREDALRIHAPFRLRRRGVETKLVLGNSTKSVDRTLLRNIANALSWLDRIKAGKTYEQIATEDAIPTDRVRKAIRYAFLAPDIVRAIVEGRQPVGLTSSYLLHHPLPDDWEKQRVLVKTRRCCTALAESEIRLWWWPRYVSSMKYPKRCQYKHAKQKKYHVRNWAEYNEGLRRRGDLTVWFDEEAIANWKADKTGKPGGQRVYSDMAIETGLVVRMVYKLAYRQTEGFLHSIASLLGLGIEIPDYATLCRRSRLLRKKLRIPKAASTQPIHLMIDSTGLRIHVGNARKPPKQRAWRKLHIAVDRETGNIVASELTASRARDATRVPALLTQIQAPLVSVAADSAYDKEAVYEAIEAHSPGRRTRVVIPPQRNATLSQNSNTAMQERDRHIRAIERHGRREWYKLSGYTKRSMVENAVYRYKAIIGPEMRARTLARQRVEHRIGCEILNKTAALGMPDTYCAG